MTKHDATLLLLGWAREAQNVFEESGETDFEELRRREKQEIFDALIETGFEYDVRWRL